MIRNPEVQNKLKKHYKTKIKLVKPVPKRKQLK